MRWQALVSIVTALAALPSMGGDPGRSAAAANAETQRRIAMMYYRGDGRPQDVAKAIDLLGKAAHGGDAEAAIILGKMHEYGLGTPPNQDLAARWYIAGAELGAHSAQLEAGIAYYKGLGIARDPAEAVKWWTLAMKGPPGFSETVRLGAQSAEAKLTPEEISEGRARARRWMSKHR
jgi:TPR repeat protein